MAGCKFILFLSIFVIFNGNPVMSDGSVNMSSLIFWPNASVPFYVEPSHFDTEQTTFILKTVSLLAFKTCLKFLPVPSEPSDSDHVLVIRNNGGLRKCDLNNYGHSIDGPHYLNLGYECLRSPLIEMQLLRAIGMPFEHNRLMRDVYIHVQEENIEPAYLDLYNKDVKLPIELRTLPYDVNSVMHFGERDFTRNGHKTIYFKDRSTKQNRISFTDLDMRKVEVVYGPECQKRDRKEKIDICQRYPGYRRKRSLENVKSLRVNPDITPPPEVVDGENVPKEVKETLKDLGIENEVQLAIDLVHKLTARALENARAKFCNKTSNLTLNPSRRDNSNDIINVIDAIAKYAAGFVEHASENLTEFCLESKSLEFYQRQRYRCESFRDPRCGHTYWSTKPGIPFYSTNHRPFVRQSTKHKGSVQRYVPYHRSGNDTDQKLQSDGPGVTKSVKKREINNPPANDTNRKWLQFLKKALLESTVELKRTNNEELDENMNERGRSSSEIANLPRIVKLPKLSKEFYAERIWPEGVVRYIISNEPYNLDDLRNRLEEVNKILKRKTCARLQELTESEAEMYPDYLVLDSSPDYVTGRVGGRQNFGAIELFEGGQHRQHTAMMVMAMLGFYFEVARQDRDKYIRVHMRHVRPNKLHHFEKIRDGATFDLPYDYESAMQPAWQFWRKIGKTGIATVATFKEHDPDGRIMKKLGQNKKLLSDLDILKINSVYGVECFKKAAQRNQKTKHKKINKDY